MDIYDKNLHEGDIGVGQNNMNIWEIGNISAFIFAFNTDPTLLE